MGRVSRPGRLVVVFAAGLLVFAAGCTGDDDAEAADEIRDISETEPAEPEPEPEPEPEAEPEPDPEPEGDSEPEESDDEGFTRAGVHVPADAFEINEDLDLDEDQQRFFLDFVVEAYLFVLDMLNTRQPDEAALQSYFAADALEAQRGSLASLQEQGWRQVNDGTVIHFARISEFAGSGSAVDLCIERGDDTGVVDEETGEFVHQLDDPIRPITYHLALVGGDEGRADWRIVEGGLNRDMACP